MEKANKNKIIINKDVSKRQLCENIGGPFRLLLLLFIKQALELQKQVNFVL